MNRHISKYGVAGLLAASLLLAGCSGSSEITSQGLPGKGAALTDPSEPAPQIPSGTPSEEELTLIDPSAPSEQILDVCSQAVADKLTFSDAATLVQASGYTARLISLDGEPMMGTMDVQMDRVNLLVENNAVIGCTFG
jgi:hypothetical protein